LGCVRHECHTLFVGAKFNGTPGTGRTQHRRQFRSEKEIWIVFHLLANRELGSNDHTGDGTKGTMIQVAN
jgi:hypothetical protein